MPLDEQLPRFDRRELHSRRVAARPAQVLVAAREVTAREVPLLVVLMALRSGPRLRRLSLDRPILGEFERSGFVRLAEADDELVYGGVGRFWTPSGGIRRISAEEFEGFAEPGYAKAAFNFLVRPAPDGGTLLSTETRVLATDPAARRSFCRYWRLIRPGSGAIRRGWLRGIARRAERAQAARSESASSSRSTSSSVV
jgi:hypothetical protein